MLPKRIARSRTVKFLENSSVIYNVIESGEKGCKLDCQKLRPVSSSMVSDSLISLVEMGGGDKKLISYKGGKTIEVDSKAVIIIKKQYEKELESRALKILEDAGMKDQLEKSSNGGCRISCGGVPKQSSPLEVYGSAVNIVKGRGGHSNHVSYDGRDITIQSPAASILRTAYGELDL